MIGMFVENHKLIGINIMLKMIHVDIIYIYIYNFNFIKDYCSKILILIYHLKSHLMLYKFNKYFMHLLLNYYKYCVLP